ncbi:MAG TPA: hypothetical protein VL752_06710 [Acidisoma sp.]|uniref:hypothetical protein n=1 Tax=Acidisoma sp. TaxID=1872115 RepID=UPI002C4ABD62|nr:hypothetical protein [Acidisoma sp.]HTI00623.1 hypothetical protein [Acidisoma sp.]
MQSLRLILALGTIAAGLAAPAFASTKHKTYHHATSHAHHEATKHEQHHTTHHYSKKNSYHHTYRKPSHKTYHHYYKPKPKPKPGIRSDGRYVLPGGMETTCAGGTPPPCR